jgi:hypothetical protein
MIPGQRVGYCHYSEAQPERVEQTGSHWNEKESEAAGIGADEN